MNKINMSDWNFFTNHGHVLFVLAQNPNLTMREISSMVGITERRAQKIIADLLEDEFIIVTKVGRNNTYQVNGDKHLRHPIEQKCCVGEIIKVIQEANI